MVILILFLTYLSFSFNLNECYFCKVLLNKDHATCGKERFIETRPQDCHSQIQSAVAWLNWVVGFIGGAKPWERERVSGLQLFAIARWNRSTCLASWVTGSSWGVFQAEIQGIWASGHKSGGLVLVLTSGPSAHPKNARDLTFQPFVGIMGANRYSYSCSVEVSLRGDLAVFWKFVRSPGMEADGLFQVLSADKANCWEKVVVASGGKSVCWVPWMILEASRVKEHFFGLRIYISIASFHVQLFFFL
jgi:hypothetical protein